LHLNIAEAAVLVGGSCGTPAVRPWMMTRDLRAFEFLDGFLERLEVARFTSLPTLPGIFMSAAFAMTSNAGSFTTHPSALRASRSALSSIGPRRRSRLPKGSIANVRRLVELASTACTGQRPDVGRDSATLLKKLPSLARIAVSAARQTAIPTHCRKTRAQTSFLIERSAAVVVPLGLDEAVRHATGDSPSRSPRSLDFALSLLHTLKATLNDAGRSVNYIFASTAPPCTHRRTVALTPQLESRKLHAGPAPAR